MNTMLPHLEESEGRPLDTLIAAIRDQSQADDLYLAVSKGFWEPDDKAVFDSVFAAYSRFFDDTVIRISRVTQIPDYQGQWNDPTFPEWAHGLRIAAWYSEASPFWLRIEHEDRECPIIIALSPLPQVCVPNGY